MAISPLALLLVAVVAIASSAAGEAKLKGYPNDVLAEYGLPKGLIPEDVNSYEFVNATGLFKIRLYNSCYIWFGNHYTHFDRFISGTISSGAISNLVGIQNRKLFIWVSITSIVSHPERGMIEFDAGRFISEEVPISLFEEIPVCGDSVREQPRGVAGVIGRELPVAEA